MDTTMHNQIMELFSYCRPMGSDTEREFVDRFLIPLGFERDEHLNLVLTVGDKPRILFSSHQDTVHRKEGRQDLKLKGGMLTQTSGSSCLGADDTAGIWLMMEMIKAKIPGIYVIHYGEEVGGIGSRAKAKHDPMFFADIDAAIAFDRRGYGDVITHQGYGRSCSDAFAWSLANQLGSGFQPSPDGIYTDTAEYTHLVPECTNISVGYEHAHSPAERQDVTFLIALREALLRVDWTALVIERDPQEELVIEERGGGRRAESLEDLCFEFPDVAAAMIHTMGLTIKDFHASIEDYHGIAA